MDATIVSVITLISTFFLGIIAVMFRKISRNEDRLSKHEVMFARISELPQRFDTHTSKEEKIFEEIRNDIGDLKVEVGIIKRIVNGGK